MATYAVGDIHGCYDAFLRLLAAVGFNPRADTLWLTGDLVNRGPQSLEVLRWCRQNENAVVAVLGNHDLHLLAVAAGALPPRAKDNFAAVFAAPDFPALCRWLLRRPLARLQNNHLLVHAGVLPAWSAADAARIARQTRARLVGNKWNFAAMYGDSPARWHNNLRGGARVRAALNALTRMRICSPAGKMNLNFAGGKIPPGYCAWFDVPQRRSANTTIVCGHWSALGLLQRQNLLALDTGCFWGGQLTAARLDDGKIFQVAGGAAA